MVSWDGLNRRKFPRVKYPCLIMIQPNSEKNEVVLTHTENVGIGGACVVLKDALKMFAQVDVEVDLLDMEEHVKCHGKIVWCVQRKSTADKKPLFYDIGIEYTNISDKDRARLETIVKALVKKNQKTFHV